jgi:putative IMPACT (imprinted ancient) family translation regulator
MFGGKCIDQYDKYKGVEELLPYAMGISAKSHSFNDDGEENSTNYSKMINLIKSSKFKGHIAIEYEGANLGMYGLNKSKYLSANDGVLATKKLIEKYI